MAKKLIGYDVGSFVFDPSERTITFSGVTIDTIEQILLITNVTDNIIIYQFNESAKGGSLSGNVLTLTFDTSAMSSGDDLQIWVWITSDSGAQEVTIVDSIDGYGAKVDEARRLQVSAPSPEAPPGKTQVINTYYGQVGGGDTETDEYIIPNGEDLVIQKLYAGAEDGDKVSIVRFYYAPDGVSTPATWQILIPFYLQGGNNEADLDEIYTGNGTRSIITQRERQDSQGREMFARWVGYY